MLRSILKSIRKFVTMVKDKKVMDYKLGFKNYDMKEYWEKRAEYYHRSPYKAVCVFSACEQLNK